MKSDRRTAAAAGVLVLLPQAALAHSPVAGVGDFYAGMLHPVVVPEALVALLAVGLLIGRQRLQRSGLAVAALLAGLGVGLAAGTTSGLASPPWALLVAAAAAAIVTLAALNVTPTALAAGGTALGAMVGAAMAQPAASAGGWVLAAGAWLGAALCALGTASVTELASRPCQCIAVRVVASWLAASAVLMLALGWLAAPVDANHVTRAATTAPAR